MRKTILRQHPTLRKNKIRFSQGKLFLSNVEAKQEWAGLNHCMVMRQ